MNANEFRVTNFVNYNGEMFPIIFIGLDSVVLIRKDQSTFTVKLDRIKPISITNDKLLKFGLKSNDNIWYKIKSKSDILFEISSSGLFAIDNMSTIRCINYLHELQNLYFALVGEELVFSSTEP